MKRADVDMINRRVRIHNGTTKNGRGVWVPIPPHPDLVAHFNSLPAKTETVFFRLDGEQLVPLGDFKKSWAKALELSGIEDFRVHDLRHDAATRMINAGTPERIVREVANRKTDMLRRYYSFNSVEACNLMHFPHLDSGQLLWPCDGAIERTPSRREITCREAAHLHRQSSLVFCREHGRDEGALARSGITRGRDVHARLWKEGSVHQTRAKDIKRRATGSTEGSPSD